MNSIGNIKIWLDGATFERDGIWVAKAPKFGVFAYADTEDEANARVIDAIAHLVEGVESEDELTARLDRSGVRWERTVGSREWSREAVIRTEPKSPKRTLAIA